MTDRYLSAEKAFKDDFDIPFSNQKGEVIYDAKTVLGPWAMMTESSWLRHGAGRLGLGLGQKYIRQENGQLHKVEG